jgi:hypothetical protein
MRHWPGFLPTRFRPFIKRQLREFPRIEPRIIKCKMQKAECRRQNAEFPIREIREDFYTQRRRGAEKIMQGVSSWSFSAPLYRKVAHFWQNLALSVFSVCCCSIPSFY